MQDRDFERDSRKNAMINRIFDANNGVWGKVRDGDFTWP
jgi:hypothetical protein